MANFSIKFVVVVALAICVHAQDTQTSQPISSISGTVLDAVTSQPLKGANVWSRSFQAGQGGRHFLSATTDAEGHFTLDSLAPGRYMVSASREDYVGRRSSNGQGSKLLTLAPDQHLEDVILQLTPGAIISGHVKNSDGKPLAGASVEVVRYSYDGGTKQLHGVRPASISSSEGEYQITGLPAGHYYLRASMAAVTETSKAPSNSSLRSKEGYSPAYYPGSSDIIRAVELVIHPGQDLSGIDLTLASVPAVDVGGRIVVAGSLTPAVKAEVNLVDTDGGTTSGRECITDAKGNFDLHDVLPGNYVLLAQVDQPTAIGKTLFGVKPLRVGKANMNKVVLVITTGAEISGRIHLEDKSDENAKVDLTKISVELQAIGNSSATALMPSVNNAVVNLDGSFLLTDVPEGTYLLNFFPLPAGYFMKVAGAVDVLETGVIVSRSQPLSGLEFSLSSKVARIEGDVSAEGQPAAGAAVVLVPEHGVNPRTRLFRQSMTDQSGRFSMKSVVPGDYKVFAFEDLERGASLNPDFLQPFEDRGHSVHVQEGSDLNVRLDAIPASETSP